LTPQYPACSIQIGDRQPRIDPKRRDHASIAECANLDGDTPVIQEVSYPRQDIAIASKPGLTG
jgi:hypothetical protein